MAVDHHKGLHPHHLHIEEAEEERAGLALSGVAEVKEVEEGNREAGEPGTLGIILQKHIIICLIFFLLFTSLKVVLNGTNSSTIGLFSVLIS